MWSIDSVAVPPAGMGSSHEQFQTDGSAYNDGEWGSFPSTMFPSINEEAPAILVNSWDKTAVSSESHIFIQHDILPPKSKRAGGYESTDLRSSPLILDAGDLTTVYLNRSFPGVTNVNVQEYDGEPILTFYGGMLDEEDGEVGNGWIWAYDQNYQQVGALSAQNLSVGADAHEFIMTGPKTGIVTAYQTIEWDLSTFSDDPDAASGTILDSIFQEIDLDTFAVLFEWRASEHIPLDMSFQPLATEDMFKFGWDYFHLTSVEKSSRGHYLISGAHTHSLYEIDGSTGAVRWTLGGKANDFAEQPSAANVTEPLLSMAWQHHARYYPGSSNEFTVFDNHGVSINGWGCSDNCSRGLHFSLDASTKQVQLLAEFLHPVGLWSTSGGSLQVLENGNIFIGWGHNPAITEHAPNGTCLFNMQFSPWRSPATEWQSLSSYRAFKADWRGTPTEWNPAIAAQTADKGSKRGVTAWMSWNGATEVASWVLLASDKTHDLNGLKKVVARSDRDGFETKVWVLGIGGKKRYLRAVALGNGSEILGASGVYDTRRQRLVEEVVWYNVTSVGVEEQETPAEAAAHGWEPEGKVHYPTVGAGHLVGAGDGDEKEAVLPVHKGSTHDKGEKAKEAAGLPQQSYHELMTMDWTWMGMFLRLSGLVGGVWAFSRLF